jgi:hypothetical protein
MPDDRHLLNYLRDLELVRELDFGLQPTNFISTSVIPFQMGRRIARIRLQILPCLK